MSRLMPCLPRGPCVCSRVSPLFSLSVQFESSKRAIPLSTGTHAHVTFIPVIMSGARMMSGGRTDLSHPISVGSKVYYTGSASAKVDLQYGQSGTVTSIFAHPSRGHFVRVLFLGHGEPLMCRAEDLSMEPCGVLSRSGSVVSEATGKTSMDQPSTPPSPALSLMPAPKRQEVSLPLDFGGLMPAELGGDDGIVLREFTGTDVHAQSPPRSPIQIQTPRAQLAQLLARNAQDAQDDATRPPCPAPTPTPPPPARKDSRSLPVEPPVPLALVVLSWMMLSLPLLAVGFCTWQ